MLAQILTICLTLLPYLAAAEEMVTIQGPNSWKYGTSGGVLGFIVLVLDILVWLEVFKSSRPASHKILWSLLVFIFPLGGIIIYWLFSNRASHNSGSGYESIA